MGWAEIAIMDLVYQKLCWCFHDMITVKYVICPENHNQSQWNVRYIIHEQDKSRNMLYWRKIDKLITFLLKKVGENTEYWNVETCTEAMHSSMNMFPTRIQVAKSHVTCIHSKSGIPSFLESAILFVCQVTHHLSWLILLQIKSYLWWLS